MDAVAAAAVAGAAAFDARSPGSNGAAAGPAKAMVAVLSTTQGILGGIARHAFPKAPMETLDHVAVITAGGVHGDFRGAIKPGGKGRRQVTLIERGDWEAAMIEVGHGIPWQERRANLLVDGLDLPQMPGVRLRIGAEVVLQITRETQPCGRMEALAAGLQAALLPDWRGGACARVVAGGHIAVGDTIRIEEA